MQYMVYYNYFFFLGEGNQLEISYFIPPPVTVLHAGHDNNNLRGLSKSASFFEFGKELY